MTSEGRLCRLVFWTFLLRLEVCQNVSSDAFRLIKDVVKLHSVLATVYPDDGQKVEVNLTFFPINIIALFEREQRFTVSGWFSVTWYDPYLRWTPSKYGGIQRVYVNDDQVWKPDLTIINGADSLQSLSGFSSELTLSSDGHLQWYPGNVFVSTCKMDLTRFPFDSQDCSFQVSTWIFRAETVKLIPTPDPIRLDNWHENSEWIIERLDVEVYNTSSDGALYPYVEYHFHLKRRSTFYVLKFLAPIVILSVVNAFVFCVPPESGEKVSLAVSTMLSLTVFLAYLTDITPSNSDTVPEVAIFVFLHLALGACGVVCNILLLKLHFYRIQQSQRRHRKMKERLWTSSVEEEDNPHDASHRKNTMESFWSSDVDENVEEEEEEEAEGERCGEGARGPRFIRGLFKKDPSQPAEAGSASRPSSLHGQFFSKTAGHGDDYECHNGPSFVNSRFSDREPSTPHDVPSSDGASAPDCGLFRKKSAGFERARSLGGSSFVNGGLFSSRPSSPEEARSGDGPKVRYDRFCGRRTSPPGRDHSLHMGAPFPKFSSTARDRYFSSSEDRANNRRRKFQRECINNMNLGHEHAGRHAGRYRLHEVGRKLAVKSCRLDCLGNICFVVFLLLSVLVSAVYFFKNI